MILNHELIEIARYLKNAGSKCKARDYTNVFEKKFGKSKLAPETIPRRLRKLRERGVFIPVIGRFVIRDDLLRAGTVIIK